MKFENENAKREFMGLLAESCAEAFIASKYPNQAFNFPFHGVPEELAYPIIELTFVSRPEVAYQGRSSCR